MQTESAPRRRNRLSKKEKQAELVFTREDYTALFLDPEFDALVHELHREVVRDKDLRPLNVDHGRYTRLCAAGMIHVLSARCNRKLVGFISFIVDPAPHALHHGPRWVVAVSDAWFLAKAHRRGMAGLRMLRAATASLQAAGVTAVLNSAPRHTKLDKLFKAEGMLRVETVWRKVLK